VVYDLKGRRLDAQTSVRAKFCMYSLKQSIVYMLLRNRRDRKVKSLRKVFEEFVVKNNKKKELRRKKRRELELMSVAEQLETMIGEDKILT